MERGLSVSIRDHFASLTDPRCANARHRLLDILVIAICSVLCGAEGWEDIEEYGQAQAEWFKQVLDVPHGILSHDTFRRVLARLDRTNSRNVFSPGPRRSASTVRGRL
jgi:hypothetical protein